MVKCDIENSETKTLQWSLDGQFTEEDISSLNYQLFI